jgi:translation initiation factor 1
MAARGLAPPTAGAAAGAAPPPDPVAFDWADHPRLRVRLQKKGRGGKKVTRLEGVVFEGAAGRAPAKAIGKALGCRAFIEDGALFAQGDQRQRLVAWLTAQGVARVDPC